MTTETETAAPKFGQHMDYARQVRSQVLTALHELNSVMLSINHALDTTQPDHRSTQTVTALQSAYCDAAATKESLEAAMRRLTAYQHDIVATALRREGI